MKTCSFTHVIKIFQRNFHNIFSNCN